LYMTLKIEIHVVELSHSFSNCLSIHMKLCLDGGEPCIKLVWLTIKFLGVWEGGFRSGGLN